MAVAVHPERVSAELLAALSGAGFEVVPVADAAGVTDSEPEEGWALVVVELGDEPAGRLGVVRRIRDAGAAPVLVVARPEHAEDLTEALLDDFLFEPVDPAELAVRATRLAIRAGSSAPDEVVSFKDLSLNLATYQATIGTSPIDLTYMEYELLRFFVTNAGRVWSREQLLSRVWGYDYFGGARTVDVHVRRLRAKLGEERSPWITTVRSVGYRFG